jgi:hypothetical protein
MPITSPSGESVYSPKIRDQSIVRKFVSQGGRGYVAIDIYNGTVSVDPDPGTLTLQVWFNDITATPGADPRGTRLLTVTSEEIHREETGKYDYQIGPPNTLYRGLLTAQWNYQVNGIGFAYSDHLQVLNPMPLYESLMDYQKSIVEQVSWMFGDMFDSTEGGPHLIEPFQTHFDYERIAQLMGQAAVKAGLTGFPIHNWGVGPGAAEQVPQELSGLMTLGTYYEVVRHLVRSYTEIPAFQGMNVTYTDRRDYSQRWQQILSTEWPDYVRMVKMAKRKMLNLGRGSLLVSGGIYGGNARGIFKSGTYAAQVRGWRFYPASPAINWGATAH